MNRRKSSALVLFDIDGTLLRKAGPHHRDVLVDAVRDITGRETTTEGVPVHGMLDPDILTQMLANAGEAASFARRHLPAIMERAQRLYVRRCPDLRKKTCPGVRRILSGLQQRGVPVGLVTGNLTRIGWKKMERAGLRPYFRFGAFAETAPDRAALARNAIAYAHGRGWIDGDARISLIGDAPSDILAARANGIQSIAVHTGISTREELEAHGPDLLLEDLRALRLAMLV